MPQRSVVVSLALGGLISTQLHRDAKAAGAPEEGTTMRFGSRECPLDISVLWTAEVDSPVYSTPAILPSSAGSRKRVCTHVGRRKKLCVVLVHQVQRSNNYNCKDGRVMWLCIYVA